MRARPQRAAGSRVILHEGRLLGFLGRTGQQLLTFLPASEPERTEGRRILAETLAGLAVPGQGVFLVKIDGSGPAHSELSPDLLAAGFTATTRGYLHRGQ